MENTEIRVLRSNELAVYLPYFPAARRPALPTALELYKRGCLQGMRSIEGAAAIPWTAHWDVQNLPVDPTHCRLHFQADSGSIERELVLPTFELVGFLSEVPVAAGSPRDFSHGFYRRLFGA
ncbi:MAG: hypothetical protein KME03_15445 [Aphanocapsa lilacina HA4352-LM1]|nr:hypothetical protein [Aphanocapsa lilacina HA4352-LM1]